MKNLRTHAVCACIMLLSIYSSAQDNKRPPLNEPDYNKPTLFHNLPDRIPVNINSVSSLFNSTIGVEVEAEIAENNTTFRIEGKVVANSRSNNDRQQNVVIHSNNFQGASLTISKVVEEDGSVNFSGRMLNLKYGDLFLLQKERDGYVLVKKNFYDLINE